jgi:Na+/glutamate symporter
MNDSHPSEQEIHEFVFEKSLAAPSVVAHIESCALCLIEVKNYQLLISELKQQTAPAFDFDLSALVIPQLPKESPLLKTDRFIAGFLVFFICCFIGVPVVLFRQYILNMFSGISPFFVYAMIGSAMVILIYKTLEMYRKYQKQMRLLNYN